jgi:ATP-dependent RNA helicase RhlB
MTFDDFSLPELVRAGIRDAGFVNPTPIQAKALPFSLEGKDVAGQAQTGTGKTAAFLLTIFSRLHNKPNREPGLPRALVLAPTRELAMQIHRDAELLGKHTGLTMTVIFGGMDYFKQRDAIKTGSDIVIATPGRLMDYYRQKVLILSNIEIVVVDEADRMFDMGFIKDIRFILKRLPSWEKRQSMLFSATLSYDVMELAYEHMNAPIEVSVESQKITADGVEQKIFHVMQSEKFHGLLRLMAAEKPERTILFSNSKRGVEMVTRRLAANGYRVGELSGDIPQKKRLKIVHDFKAGDLDVVVATDVASRGLHVDNVTHVINFDLPQDCEDYVHRIGRTARAGATGRALSLVDEDSAFNLESIEKYVGHKLDVGWLDEYPDVEEKRAPFDPSRRGDRLPPGRGGPRGGGGGRGGPRGGGGRGRGGPPRGR